MKIGVSFPPFEVPLTVYRAKRPRAVAVLIPAMGTSRSFYRPFAEDLVSREMSVVTAEIPGTGDSRPRLSRSLDYGYRDLVEVYLPGVVQRAREHVESVPVVLIGHSLGAHLGALAVSTGYKEIDVLVTMAGGNIDYRNWAGMGRLKVRLAGQLFSAMSRLFGYLPGQHVGFGCGQARTLIQQWSRVISTGNYSHIYPEMSAGSSVPALCIGFEGDDLCPEKSVTGLASLLHGEARMLEAAGKSNPHASWARRPEASAGVIESWLHDRGLISD